MGRRKASYGGPPAAARRDARAKRAKATLNQDIPALLQAYPRAKQGIDTAELIVAPPVWTATNNIETREEIDSRTVPSSQAGTLSPQDNTTFLPSEKPTTALHLEVRVTDTFEAAHTLLESIPASRRGKRSKVAVLNLASPLRPGGGFLTGATAQEESLCMRSTLYPSLKESYYRLPEVGAIYTSDVLVFRGWDAEYTDLPRSERFFVDVVTAAMLRFPDVEQHGEEKRYANPKDRELAEQKMRAVMRILKMKRIENVVLGAWGCGAYKNPLGEIARLWRKVLLPALTDRTHDSDKMDAAWGPMRIIFAINDPKMAKDFARLLGPEIAFVEQRVEQVDELHVRDAEDDVEREANDELGLKIAELKEQIAQTRNPELKLRLEVVLAGLMKSLQMKEE